MMNDYIGRDKAIAALQNTINDPACPIFIATGVKQILSQLPAANVRPIVRGEWKTVGMDAWSCSNCNSYWRHIDGFNFCPNCGAINRNDYLEKERKK